MLLIGTALVPWVPPQVYSGNIAPSYELIYLQSMSLAGRGSGRATVHSPPPIC